jgi:hypothetical protein
MARYRIKSYVGYYGNTYYVAEYKPNWWSLWREHMYHYETQEETLADIQRWKEDEAKELARKNRKYTYKEVI